MIRPSLSLTAIALAALLLAGCDQPPAAGPPGPATVTAQAPTASQPAAAAQPLVRPGAQVVTLTIRNATDLPLVALSANRDGQDLANLLPAGTVLPPGGQIDLPVSPGLIRLSARLQPPGLFTQGRVIRRNVQVPTFPPNPPPRMPVTLR